MNALIGKDGGREGIRTPGLLVANEALSQLSYSPTSSVLNFSRGMRAVPTRHVPKALVRIALLAQLRSRDQAARKKQATLP
jgi:hypothetical protein